MKLFNDIVKRLTHGHSFNPESVSIDDKVNVITAYNNAVEAVLTMSPDLDHAVQQFEMSISNIQALDEVVKAKIFEIKTQDKIFNAMSKGIKKGEIYRSPDHLALSTAIKQLTNGNPFLFPASNLKLNDVGVPVITMAFSDMNEITSNIVAAGNHIPEVDPMVFLATREPTDYIENHFKIIFLSLLILRDFVANSIAHGLDQDDVLNNLTGYLVPIISPTGDLIYQNQTNEFNLPASLYHIELAQMGLDEFLPKVVLDDFENDPDRFVDHHTDDIGGDLLHIMYNHIHHFGNQGTLNDTFLGSSFDDSIFKFSQLRPMVQSEEQFIDLINTYKNDIAKLIDKTRHEVINPKMIDDLSMAFMHLKKQAAISLDRVNDDDIDFIFEFLDTLQHKYISLISQTIADLANFYGFDEIIINISGRTEYDPSLAQVLSNETIRVYNTVYA